MRSPESRAFVTARSLLLAPLRAAVGAAAGALATLDAALNHSAPAAAACGEAGKPAAGDLPAALQAARETALSGGDLDLAERLQLLERQARQPSGRDTAMLLPGRAGSGDRRLEDIRRSLLVATPRPADGADD